MGTAMEYVVHLSCEGNESPPREETAMRFREVVVRLYDAQYQVIDWYDMLLCIDTQTPASLAGSQREGYTEARVEDRVTGRVLGVAYADGQEVNYV